MIEAIRQAEKDKTVKAIVLRVDSPGGSALASDLIWNELVHCKKPVIASMSDVAASGGYYIAWRRRRSIAEPGTLTGSIGVFGGKMALGGVYEKVGINTEVISAAPTPASSLPHPVQPLREGGDDGPDRTTSTTSSWTRRCRAAPGRARR